MATEMLRASNKTVQSVAFADALKGAAINVLGLDRDLVYGSNEDKETLTHVMWDTFPNEIRLKYSTEEIEVEVQRMVLAMQPAPRTGPMTIRDILQVMGTDIFRLMFDGDVWTRAVFSRQWDADVVLITDCRFPNEKKVTEEHSGVIIRLERDTGLEDSHLSETALDGYDFEYLYHNSGSLEDLETFVRDTLTSLGLL